MLICPSCRKRYETGLLTCTKCGTELLPPSALQLQDRHPSRTSEHHRQKTAQQEDLYVKLLQCSLNEAKDITRLLGREGISYLIERDEDFRFQYHPEGGSQIADQRGLIVNVKATELSKARALLEWEIQQELDEEAITHDTADETELLICPSCEAELSASDETCPECGLALDIQDEEEIEESYRCSACGAPCHPTDPICPSCGVRFDH